MKIQRMLFILVCTTLMSAQVLAVDMAAGEALAESNGCLTCHATDHKVVGPSYQEVAAKYKGDKGATAKLVEKIKKGGSGVWGDVPMAANSPKVSDADIKTLVAWVLAH